MIIVKLGGSVITDKKRPLTARPRAIASMAGALAEASEPLIVVHGGGSFGHYWSVRHDMHTRPARRDPAAVAAVKNSMVDLDAMVLRAMAGKGIGPYALPPHALVRPGGDRASAPAVREAGMIAESGLVPVTYGDALWRRGGMAYIMSGDRLVSMLSLALRPRLAVFATDVDGLYRDMDSRELIPRIGAAGAGRMAESLSEGGTAAGIGGRAKGPAPRRAQAPDVTGGIRRKVLEAARLAGAGIDVAFVNGNRPGRILEAAAAAGRGRRRPGRFTGTLFAGAGC